MLKQLKILIVEDEGTLAENIMAHIQRCKGEAVIASTGQQAIAAVQNFTPDVILLDYQLPDMNGFEALDAIRATNLSCPCVLMTGHPLDEVTPAAQRRGINQIINKPFALAEIAAALLNAAGEGRRMPGTQQQSPERRQKDRRANMFCIFFSLRLSDGTVLAHDRRAQHRRELSH